MSQSSVLNAQPPVMLVDTAHSPYVRLRPVPITNVKLADHFWSKRQAMNHDVTLPTQLEQCETTGRIDNFRRASGKIQGDFRGYFFNDSDVYKWMEAAAWELARQPDAALEASLNAVIDELEAAQGADGYLDTYFTFEREAERWTNLQDLHEMYCAGHLIQAGVAHKRATGSNRLLNIARRFADLICDVFGPEEEGKRPGTDGHPEIEVAMVELYRLTGEQRYLDQADYLLTARGHGLLKFQNYCQDEKPFRELEKTSGHSVRALYLCAGATDIYAETGEPALLESLQRQWDYMVSKQMYLTGGLGSVRAIEGFGEDYELPNAAAYTETCAAIASVMWNWRMLALTGDAKYADLMEHTLYNAFLPGLALDGRHYFYVNPLANDGSHRRQVWYECACCPPNIARTLAALGGYCYNTSDEGLWVHLYAESDAEITLHDGRLIRLHQDAEYPFSGEMTYLELIDVPAGDDFSIFMRIPGWCDTNVGLSINGQPYQGELILGSYVELRRAWQSGDRVTISLPMPVRLIEANPKVTEDLGKVALMRGPIVYCLEAADNPGLDLDAVRVGAADAFISSFSRDILGGIHILRGRAEVLASQSDWEGKLYMPRPETPKTATITAIPYYAWANREAGPMRVWLRG